MRSILWMMVGALLLTAGASPATANPLPIREALVIAEDTLCASSAVACNATRGDPQASTFRPCAPDEPRPQDGIYQWVLWYGVTAFDDRRTFSPEGRPINPVVPWLIPEVAIPIPEDAPHVCGNNAWAILAGVILP